MALRPRRLRRGETVRALVREHRVSVEQLVAPMFVAERAGDAGPIASMPGIARLTADGALEEARELFALGIRSVLLFGIPAHKDPLGSSNYDPQGVVQRVTRAIKAALPEMLLIADLCSCEYTDHGHCGILDARGDVD
ncbi:MAG: porphobilinogen synthase, partial [Candidatus Tumulicola sp.]